jgi:phospholipid/cholesterol/gamma-HCH transport system substrate-binding protein
MAAQQQRAVIRTAVLGVVGTAIMMLVVYVAFTAHQGLPFRTTTTVRAAFHDVGAIHPDSEVRQNSLRIGQVAQIDYVNGQAIVTLALDGHRQVFADAHAAVWDFSALGQKFIEFSPGSPPAGPLGDRVITADRDQDSADLYQLFDVFDPTTLAAATSATRQLGDGAAGHGPDFQALLHIAPQLLPGTGTVSEALAAPDTNLPALLRSADELSARLVSRQHQISDDLIHTDATLRGFTIDNTAPLAATLRTLPATLDSAHRGFDRLNQPLADTASFFGDFRSGGAALARSENDLRGVLREAPHPLEKVPSVSDDAKPALADLRDTVADAHPLAPRLTQLFDNLAHPVQAVAPYARDTASLWARLQNMTSENINGKYYGRTSFNVNGKSLGAISGSTDIGNDPYPKPGHADLERIGGLISEGKRR